MITKNILKQPKAIVEVAVTIPWADLQPKWDVVLQKLNADLELPGFRKGQVPLPMAEQNLGNKLQDEFLKTVMPQFLVEALQGSGIVPIDYPKYQLLSFAKGSDLSFKAQITEKPEIKIGDYKALRAVKPAVKLITDEDVNKLVDDLFKRWKVKQSSVVGPAVAGSSATNGVTTPQAAGSMSFNQSNDVPASPASTRGEPSVSLGGPDDNFAKAMGALSLIDLKTKIKTDLENEAKYNNELDYEEAILQEIEKITTVELPDILVNDELNRMLVSLQRRVADMGLLLEDYLKGQNKTLDGLKAEWKVQAEKNVRMELGLSEVARLEKVDISDTEVQAEVDKIQDAKMKQIKTLDLLKALVKTA